MSVGTNKAPEGVIVGAGLAGLILAHAFPKRGIIEVQPKPQEIHKALLRFRSTAVADLTGIEFKAVNVRKGIFANDGFCEPNINLCNAYAKKVVGKIIDRSIWNLDPVTRYIAPTDFYEQLIDSVGDRIRWGESVEWERAAELGGIISTAPMHIPLKALGREYPVKFERAAINVQRFKVNDCNVYQTIYFPTDEHSMYRASITGDLLIVEHAAGQPFGNWWGDLINAFGLGRIDLYAQEEVQQTYGKIAPIDDGLRKQAISVLSDQCHIYSVGRFATWRNILLDDVVHDAAVVKRLINADAYAHKLEASR